MTVKESIESSSAHMNLTKGFTEIVMAKTRFEVLFNDESVHPDTRSLMRHVARHVNNGINKFRNSVPDRYKKMFNSTLLDIDTSMQVDNIYSMILDLPPAIRDQVESYVTGMHKAYSPKN